MMSMTRKVLLLVVLQSAIGQAFQLAMVNEVGSPMESSAAKSIKTNAGREKVKLIVCQGSSCEGRCRAMFNPKHEFRQLVEKRETPDIEIEEVNCMNMCKKGPNVRMVLDGEVVTIPTQMNDIEQRRKAFTGVGGDPGIQRVWGAANSLLQGTLEYEKHGPPPEH